MIDAAGYSAIETLRDGRRIEIRALRPEDRSDLAAAIDRASAQSLYRRFFAVKRGFTEKETDFFVNVDFVDHVALVAVIDEDGQPAIVGGGRYIVVQPGKAEVAFAVIDDYQGQGVGAALMRHLVIISREAGLQELVAEVLPENVPMLKLFEKCGCRLSTKREAQVVHVTLGLNQAIRHRHRPGRPIAICHDRLAPNVLVGAEAAGPVVRWFSIESGPWPQPACRPRASAHRRYKLLGEWAQPKAHRRFMV